MSKKNKSRELIHKGLNMHLNGISLKIIFKTYDNFYVDYNFSKLDKAFVRYITLEAICNRGIIEIVLKRFLNKPLPKKMTSVKAGLMLGVAQILYSNVKPHAAVNTTVDVFKKEIFKWRGLANAVLRKILINKDEFLKLKTKKILNIPVWFLNKWIAQYGKSNTNKIIECFNKGIAIDIKFKKNKINKYSFKGKQLENNTIRISNQGEVRLLEGYEYGDWWVQDISAQLPVLCLGNVKNKRVIELCAAPGGKTCQLLELGANVLAIDKSHERLEILNSNVIRINLKTNLELLCRDVLHWSPKKKFDLILLDVPCTSTGTIRKNPDIIWHKNKIELRKITKIQKLLLKKAINMLADNGILVYSNCSMEKEEGELIIHEIIKEEPVEIDNIKKQEINGFSDEIFVNGMIRTLPYMYKEFGGIDGFFIARLKKISHN